MDLPFNEHYGVGEHLTLDLFDPEGQTLQPLRAFEQQHIKNVKPEVDDFPSLFDMDMMDDNSGMLKGDRPPLLKSDSFDHIHMGLAHDDIGGNPMELSRTSFPLMSPHQTPPSNFWDHQSPKGTFNRDLFETHGSQGSKSRDGSLKFKFRKDRDGFDQNSPWSSSSVPSRYTSSSEENQSPYGGHEMAPQQNVQAQQPFEVQPFEVQQQQTPPELYQLELNEGNIRKATEIVQMLEQQQFKPEQIVLQLAEMMFRPMFNGNQDTRETEAVRCATTLFRSVKDFENKQQLQFDQQQLQRQAQMLDLPQENEPMLQGADDTSPVDEEMPLHLETPKYEVSTWVNGHKEQFVCDGNLVANLKLAVYEKHGTAPSKVTILYRARVLQDHEQLLSSQYTLGNDLYAVVFEPEDPITPGHQTHEGQQEHLLTQPNIIRQPMSHSPKGDLPTQEVGHVNLIGHSHRRRSSGEKPPSKKVLSSSPKPQYNSRQNGQIFGASPRETNGRYGHGGKPYVQHQNGQVLGQPAAYSSSSSSSRPYVAPERGFEQSRQVQFQRDMRRVDQAQVVISVGDRLQVGSFPAENQQSVDNVMLKENAKNAKQKHKLHVENTFTADKRIDHCVKNGPCSYIQLYYADVASGKCDTAFDCKKCSKKKTTNIREVIRHVHKRHSRPNENHDRHRYQFLNSKTGKFQDMHHLCHCRACTKCVPCTNEEWCKKSEPRSDHIRQRALRGM